METNSNYIWLCVNKCLAPALPAAPAVIGMQYLQAAANELLILNKKVGKLLQRGRCSGVDDGTVGWGDGMFPLAVNTNHCLLATISDASFDWEL